MTALELVSCRPGESQCGPRAGLVVEQVTGGRGFRRRSFVAAIELKAEWFAERRQRSFGGVGFRGFKGNIMDFAGRVTTAFA